jgi:glucose-1-phosphate adenylyltransferase
MKLEPFAVSQLPKRALALVLAGGRGSRLHELTDIRSKPAVYFGGKFRIVDFTLSNCLNSGLRRIAVLTQYKSHSLLRHLQRGWSFLKPELNEWVDLLPAQQRIDESTWYQGTADAVFQNLDILRSEGPEYIVVLAGDHIYKMDYGAMLRFHVEHDARCTVACFEVPIAEASAFGVMSVNDQGRIVEFVEKPPQPPPMPGHPDLALASMGIYVFDAEYLYEALARDAADPHSVHDFGRNLVPAAVAEGVAYAQPFDDANIDLTATKPQLNLYDRAWPIWTYQEQLPSAKFVHNEPDRRGLAIESMVSGGCIISGALFRSLLFSNCRVHSWALVNWSVLLPNVEVGRRARLTRTVVDRGCRIPDGLVVGEDPADDARRFRRTAGGVTLITRGMLAKLG